MIWLTLIKEGQYRFETPVPWYWWVIYKFSGIAAHLGIWISKPGIWLIALSDHIDMAFLNQYERHSDEWFHERCTFPDKVLTKPTSEV